MCPGIQVEAWLLGVGGPAERTVLSQGLCLEGALRRAGLSLGPTQGLGQATPCLRGQPAELHTWWHGPGPRGALPSTAVQLLMSEHQWTVRAAPSPGDFS